MIQKEPQFDYEIDRGVTPRSTAGHPLDQYAKAAYLVWALESMSTPVKPWDLLLPRERETWREVADVVLIRAQMSDKSPGAE